MPLLLIWAGALVFLAGCRSTTAPAAQNPSPMQEHTRAHVRVGEEELAGSTFRLKGILNRDVSVFVPDTVRVAAKYDLLIHFHGSAFIANTAVSRADRPMIAVNVHLGAGSSVYEQRFLDPDALDDLVDSVTTSLSNNSIVEGEMAHLFLSAFSAGYGAIRAILRSHAARIDGVLLLDGLHTDYVPPRVVLHDGGSLEDSKLEPFVTYARMAVEGRKRFLITHSEIFPGTFASTTETSDYVIAQLGLKRNPVLDWGPGGMQLLSRTEAGRFTVLGFAGNTAPDHVDHFHGLPHFLSLLVRM